jgi:hypothetical protein
MKINEALELLAKLEKTAIGKKELQGLNKFSQLLKGLVAKDLSQEKISSIEEKLGSMSLGENSNNIKRYWTKKAAHFMNYLSRKFNLIPEGHYLALGVAFGSAFGSSMGTVIGVLSDNLGLAISMGVSFGLVLGLLIGKFLDDKAQVENRVLKSEISI